MTACPYGDDICPAREYIDAPRGGRAHARCGYAIACDRPDWPPRPVLTVTAAGRTWTLPPPEPTLDMER